MGLIDDWLDRLFHFRDPPPPLAVPPPPLPTNAGTTSSAVVIAVNAFRSSHGLHPLAHSPLLMAAANAWSARMAGGLGMTHGIGPTSFRSRMAAASLNAAASGECVAEGQPDAASVVAAWESDAPHRAILLGRDFTRGGAGVARDGDGTPFWTFDAASGLD